MTGLLRNCLSGRVPPHNLPMCEAPRGAVAVETEIVSDIEATNCLECRPSRPPSPGAPRSGRQGTPPQPGARATGSVRRFCLRAAQRRRCPVLAWRGCPATSWGYCRISPCAMERAAKIRGRAGRSRICHNVCAAGYRTLNVASLAHG